MRAVGRLEPATFTLLDERVNHCATITDCGLGPAIINFEWWHVTLTNPDCELISLYQNFNINYIKQIIRRRNIDEIPYIEFKYGVFGMDRLHDRHPKP